jgi:hypothetical protein
MRVRLNHNLNMTHRILTGLVYGIPPRPPNPESLATSFASPPGISPEFFNTGPPETLYDTKQKLPDVVQTHDDSEREAAHIRDCFQAFKDQLQYAETRSVDERRKLVLKACRDCCPDGDDTGLFALLVHRHLSTHDQTAWTDEDIVACLLYPRLHLPPIASDGARRMLRTLEKMSATASNARRLRPLFRKYAKQVGQDPSTPDSATQDLNLCLLIRGIWGAARLLPSTDIDILHGGALTKEDKALSLALGQRISAPRLRTDVCSILKEPTRASSQILAIVSSHLSDSIKGSNVLEIIPRRLLYRCTQRLQPLLLEADAIAPNITADSSHLETWLSMLLRTLNGTTTNRPVKDLTMQTLADLVRDHHSAKFSTAATPPLTIALVLLQALARHRSMRKIPQDRLTSFTRSFTGTFGRPNAADLCLRDLLVKLVAALGEASLPNSGVLDIMIPMIDEYAGIKSVLELLQRMQTSGGALSSAKALRKYSALVADRTAIADTSSEQKRQHVALALRTCHHINQLLTDMNVDVRAPRAALGRLQARRQFDHIMRRAVDAKIVPLSMRNHHAVDLPSRAKVQLIHEFAYQYSLDRTRSHLQIWRSMYYLYKYVRQNRLGFDVRFTKAVLEVLIIRPLSENRLVSSRRLVWVCELVAEVEGPEAAKKIEHMFWVWRGDLIIHAKSTLNAAGVQGRAHVNTMKKLGMI